MLLNSLKMMSWCFKWRSHLCGLTASKNVFHSSIDTAALRGESVPVVAQPGDVFSSERSSWKARAAATVWPESPT